VSLLYMWSGLLVCFVHVGWVGGVVHVVLPNPPSETKA